MGGLVSYAVAYDRIVGKASESDADPLRLKAAAESADRSRMLRDGGFISRDWKPSRLSPAAKRSSFGFWEWDQHLTEGWLDHPYRLINKGKGRAIYVAEPYGLMDLGLRSLARLQATGEWNVSVLSQYALHFPGWTVAVWIERKAQVTA